MGEGWGMEEGDRIGRHGHHRGRLPGMRHKGRWGERRDDAGKYVAADRYLRCAAELGLSDDQKSKLKELAFKTKKEMIDLRASVQKARLELKELVRSEDPNLREIKRQLDALAAAQADLRYKRIASMLEAREILTPEQRKRLEEK